MKRKFTQLLLAVFLSLIVFNVSIGAKAIFAEEPFNCNDGIAYQTINSTADNTSGLYGFDVTTGVKTLIATLPFHVNGLIYNSVDNMLWAFRLGTNNVARIDKAGATSSYPIPNLPSELNLNVGAELPNGYLLLYSNNTANYYVVDVNPSRTTYLQLVDPTAGFVLKTGPDYGIPMSSPLAVSDIAFVSKDQLCYGITTQSQIATLDPFTGTVVVGAAVDGLPSSGNYGAVFSDVSGRLYAFHNGLGSFYLIHPSTSSASLISTSAPSSNNDGASCANTTLVDLPFNCNDGIAYQTINSLPTSTSALHGFDVNTGVKTLIATLPYILNGLIYNSMDNMLWASRTGTNNIVRIDREGGSALFPIANLPSGLNVGAELPNGYMLLYNNNNPDYYVVDVDPNRATYLQLVDPTAGFVLKMGPNYGTAVSTPLAIADLAFVSKDQLCYGLTTSSQIASLDPFTGNVVVGATVTGLPATDSYGAVFSDIAGRLYAFQNSTGSFYMMNPSTNAATLISTSDPSGSNDGASCANTTLADLPFTCNDGIAYQTINDTNAFELHGFDVNTGVKTLIAALPYNMNALIYNSVDNMLWAARTGTNEIVRIDREGGSATYPVPNLPSGLNINVGAELPGGYMLLYSSNTTEYYVVDVNRSRATYLQLVDPTAGFALKTGPNYGTAISSPLAIQDIAFVSKDQLCYGISGGQIATLDPFTGNVVVGAAVGGLPTTGGYGAVFSDVSGRLYAFHNNTGSFYLVHPSTNTAALISTSAPSGNNDGASCASTSLADLPFTCSDGITYQTAAVAGSPNSSLFALNVATGVRTLIAPLPYAMNSLIYNSTDNMLWAAINAASSIARIDRDGGVVTHLIANLPNVSFNIGVELPNGYMMLTSTSNAYYYVIDLDASRPTYLQLVDPTAGFILKMGPEYGTAVSSPLDISDIAFVSGSQLAYGITSQAKLASLNPLTGAVVVQELSVTGLPNGGYGAVVTDATGYLYAFLNTSGEFFRIKVGENTANLVANFTPSGGNDGANCANTVLVDLPFACNDGITYQTVAVVGSPNSSLYALDVSTGVRTLIAPLPHALNSLIYNSADNMLWATINSSNSIVRIDSEGSVVTHLIANLPNDRSFNIGVELPNGYMMLTSTSNPNYYVIDINKTRSTYLQLVDPTAGFVLKTGPEYGTALSSPLDISDIAFVSGSQLAYGVTSLAKLASLNPLTGNVVVKDLSVTGLPAGAYGGVVTDATGLLYAFNNSSGEFYRINVESNTATLVATFTPSGGNDGANCSTATLCDLSLTVSSAPIQPVCIGNTVTFSVTASGTGSFTYQWQTSPDNGTTWTDLSSNGETTVNGTYSGAGTATLSVVPASLTWNGNLYRVNVGNGDCSLRSNNLQVNVFEVPVAPVVSEATVDLPCNIVTADLTALVTSTAPLGSTLAFYTSSTPSAETLVSDPTQAVRGIYFAFYVNATCASGTKITVAGCPLPVTLVSFTVTKEESGSGGIALLNWATTEEVNSESFQVERGGDGKSWKQVGNLPAQGESSVLKNYEFVDPSPLKGGNYYRLKMVDQDGTFSYSRIRFAEFAELNESVYPNPASRNIFFTNYEEIREVVVYNSIGVKMLHSQTVSSTGLNVSNLSQGIYIAVLTLNDGSTSAQKIVIVK